jgi:hypothetical protein
MGSKKLPISTKLPAKYKIRITIFISWPSKFSAHLALSIPFLNCFVILKLEYTLGMTPKVPHLMFLSLCCLAISKSA